MTLCLRQNFYFIIFGYILYSLFNHTGGKPHRKMTFQKDNLTGKWPHMRTTTEKEDIEVTQRKITSQEGNLKGSWDQRKTTGEGKQAHKKETSQEDDLKCTQRRKPCNTRKRPNWMRILACLASQFCTELCPARPSLFFLLIFQKSIKSFIIQPLSTLRTDHK